MKKSDEQSWVLVNEYEFNKVRKMVDNAVKSKKGPRVNGKKVTYHHLHDFLEDILNGKFNNREEAKQCYLKNIFNNYEMPVRNNATSSSSFVNLINAYDDVRKIFIKPSKPSVPIDDDDKKY